ncbi:GntR family transcriptional regulator [Halomonas alkalisoli]|uniref:GntR family transcriptional regulator n=1 Tax=Halomonas alkalisoli TaxID=2907158 RepID=UPI001F46A0D8|nr:GntR family transcriptional regulator [Halomonas alkalisoli]MCE9684026.1 GntR family transcriptional regulator [Halomonas alkalisoli]
MNQAVIPKYQPLYQQIKEALLSRVMAGEWPPGTFIPSESSLAEQYSVSVGTLRKALDALANDNVVIRYQGKGTAVATHDSDRSLFQFFHLIGLDGSRCLPISRVLTRERRAATREEASALELEQEEEVVHIRRIRELDNRPALLEDLAVSATRFAGLEQEPTPLPNTLYHLYQHRFSHSVAHAEERLFAVAADADDNKYLGVEIGSPLLEIRRIAKDLKDTPLEYRVSRCETEHHCYFNKL